MKRCIFPLLMIALLITSCGTGSSDYKKMKAENDSLVLANAQAQAQFDDMLQTMNEVEAGFSKIKEAENFLVEAQVAGEMDKSQRERMISDVQLVQETLQKNKERIADLEQQMKKNNANSKALRKTIERLKAEIEQKSIMITTLQEELAKKNIRIQELDESVAALASQVTNLSEETAQNKETMKKQDDALNTAWYVFGTKDELKKQNILTGGGLFKSAQILKGDFSKDYFTKVDIRKLKTIPLYSKKAKILTNQPAGSYTLIKDESGNLTLNISDFALFWSVSKFLVILVD